MEQPLLERQWSGEGQDERQERYYASVGKKPVISKFNKTFEGERQMRGRSGLEGIRNSDERNGSSESQSPLGGSGSEERRTGFRLQGQNSWESGFEDASSGPRVVVEDVV